MGGGSNALNFFSLSGISIKFHAISLVYWGDTYNRRCKDFWGAHAPHAPCFSFHE